MSVVGNRAVNTTVYATMMSQKRLYYIAGKLVFLAAAASVLYNSKITKIYKPRQAIDSSEELEYRRIRNRNTSIINSSKGNSFAELLESQLLGDKEKSFIDDDAVMALVTDSTDDRIDSFDSTTDAGSSASPVLSTSETGFNIAFIGDSLTRYQYMDLIYYIRFGRWASEESNDELQSPTYVMQWPEYENWNQYYNALDIVFNGTEICNCFRPNGHYLAYKKAHVIYENRYFHYNSNKQQTRGSHYLTLITKWGSLESHGHWAPEQVYQGKDKARNVGVNLTHPDLYGAKYNWRYKQWSDVITEYVAKLQPKPEFVVLNAGLWPHDFNNKTVIDDIRTALDSVNITGIYKTTTKVKTDSSIGTEPYEEYACSVIHHCLNLSWTGLLNNSVVQNYIDDKHFTPRINKRFNEHFFQLIDDIRSRNTV